MSEHHHGHHHEHAHDHEHEEPMTQEEVVSSLLVLGEVALGAHDYESAFDAYASVLKLEQNETALYNLGSLYARGVGVRRNYAEAAHLFHQAELMGNEQAGKLCGKCMFDFVHEGFDSKTPAGLYAAMVVFVLKVYPEAADQKAEVKRGLFVIAATHYNKGEYAEAAKVFRAAAEFGNDGYAQYYLAQLYNNGAGVAQNDLVSLYWLDCAVDNGAAEVALDDRDGMLEAFHQSLTALEFRAAMEELATWCETGTPDVPANADKAVRWHGVSQA